MSEQTSEPRSEPMASPVPDDEFYVGYLPETPDGIAAHVRQVAVVIGLAFLGVALALAVVQKDFDVAFFDFGAARTFEGVVVLEPQPMLRVDRPGRSADAAVPTSDWLLVGFGKAGALAEVEDFAGRRVKLEGTPIYRDDQTMLEIVTGSVELVESGESTAARTSAAHSLSLGEQILEGEIVDSKCYLGVMKPGAYKPHKACATLCIRGGIPPIFVLRENGEPVGHLLLVGPEGKALGDEILPFVAEPVRIRGEVRRSDDTWILRADPSSLERLP